MITEPFTAGNSMIHRIDPALKTLFAALFSCTIAVSESFYSLAAAMLLAVMLIWTARLNITDVVRRLSVLMMFTLLIWLVLPATFGGRTLFELGPLRISKPGVLLCAKITLKSVAILSILISLVATATLSNLGDALHRLRIPGKLVFLLVMSYRYIFVIENEYRRLIRAARIRGFKPGTNIHSYKTFAYLIGMIFIRASARADRVYQAMLCRGFNRRFHTLGFRKPYVSGGLFSALMTLCFIILIGLELWNRMNL
jgi:cobalt/nickel transport system permease protein